ncbi:MAG: 16S rRNA (uracil(1498)-N(3))-methyltransferase [Ruminococcaceae bacterium]|nr:16S rRNA (uracil(1498)-N(3))-methyltransferase [Oscillospiraceae bacterium]
MPRFFIDDTPAVGASVTIDGADARHIAGALRMTPGESLTLCDGKGMDFACTITGVERETVTLSVDAAIPTTAEPTLAVTLYMGLPKGDKMEMIIQKCVELGVTAIVPVATSRCIVKLDGKDAAKKQTRWQKIANEAAGQSGRGILPVVETPISWKQALSRFERENTLLCYEGGGAPIGQLVSPADTAVSLVVGPEGGFDIAEVEAVTAVGGRIATLGPRILRCETAPLAALAVLMEKSGNMA